MSTVTERRTPKIPIRPKPDEGLWAADVAERLGIKRASLTKLRSRSTAAPRSPAFPQADGIDLRGRRGVQEWWLPATIDAYKANRPGQVGRPRQASP